MSKKIKVHIIHHTHWDMEWYFTTHDTNSLFNYNIKHLFNELDRKESGSFLFDGQTSMFEEFPKHAKEFQTLTKLVKANKLKIGPWYSQPDMRLTSDEGILRNYHYGQNVGTLKSNKCNYLYTPDSFGFGENIPIIHKLIGKKYSILWRGVNRKAIKGATIFNWKAKNGQKIIVYNMVSGYFVGRYLYNDETLNSMYINNILPAIKMQSQNGKYSVVAIPAGGDQQPFNNDLKNAIQVLNSKKDGNEYLLSTWEDFFKELEPQINQLPTYVGSLTTAYGGRLHKPLGANRTDIKQLIFKGELSASRILEPLLLMSELGNRMYPTIELDKMWKNILLSQAHDAYASCNSDIVNKNIKDRLLASQNIYEANKDMIIRFISNNFEDNKLLIFNPTLFKGERMFSTQIATYDKTFSIENIHGEVIPYFIKKQKKYKGGVQVTYVAKGEVEKKKPPYYVFDIEFLHNVKKQSISTLSIIEGKTQVAKYNTSFNIKNISNCIKIFNNESETNLDLKFKLDAGDGYDLDIYEEVPIFTLKDAQLLDCDIVSKNGIKVHAYNYEITLPNSIKSWIKSEKVQKMGIQIKLVLGEYVKVEFKFNNVPNNLLVQSTFNNISTVDKHKVLSHAGYIDRNNKIDTTAFDSKEVREASSDFDIMHGNIFFGTEHNNISFSSLSMREYLVKDNKVWFNIFRSPDVLGRANLRSRPGRASGLPDKTIYTPNTAKEINGTQFDMYIDFNKQISMHPHIIDGILIENLTIHKQNLYKYNGKTNTWTLPKLKATKKLITNVEIENPFLILMAHFKSPIEYTIRINNPLQKEVTSNLRIYKVFKEDIKFKPNEIKEFRIKI